MSQFHLKRLSLMSRRLKREISVLSFFQLVKMHHVVPWRVSQQEMSLRWVFSTYDGTLMKWVMLLMPPFISALSLSLSLVVFQSRVVFRHLVQWPGRNCLDCEAACPVPVHPAGCVPLLADVCWRPAESQGTQGSLTVWCQRSCGGTTYTQSQGLTCFFLLFFPTRPVF